jgi:hypothetical protein
MPDETLETTLAPATPAVPRRGALVRFLRVPLEARSYSNLLFLALAFPLGLVYFIFLSVGLTLGVGLTLILIGLPLLALVLAASWGLTALERQLAIHLLGAEVPPMRPAQPAPRRGFLLDALDFLGNPVAWKGMGYLILKLPLGIITFVVTISLLAVSASLLIAPFVYPTGLLEWDGMVWNLDSPGAAVLCGALGVVIAFLSLHVFNGLAWVWRTLASAMLGSARFTAA